MRLFPFIIPQFFNKLFGKLVWELENTPSNKIYLTFDDGPHPVITPWVLDILATYNAKATFFVVGQNAEKNPQILQRIIEEGHALGNHTDHHLSGYNCRTKDYIADVKRCQQYTQTDLFRPPYGRIKRSQVKQLNKTFQIVMWNQLSGDFYKNLDIEKSLQALRLHTKKGNIVVFHDSQKSFENLKLLLPAYLNSLKEQGFSSIVIPHKKGIIF